MFHGTPSLDIGFEKFTQLAHLSVAASIFLENPYSQLVFAGINLTRILPGHPQTLSIEIRDEETEISGITAWLRGLQKQKPCKSLRHVQLRFASSLHSFRSRLAPYIVNPSPFAFAPLLMSPHMVARMRNYDSDFTAIMTGFQNDGIAIELLFCHARLSHQFVRIPWTEVLNDL